MIILFYGGFGWIGDQLKNEFERLNHTVILSKIKIQPNQIKELEEELLSIKPDRVICCLGRTSGYDEQTNNYINNIDYLENHIKENVNDNLYSPITLGLLCNILQIHLTYLGTGCIFNEDTRELNTYSYKEEDIPDFFGSGYSVVKGYTEQILKYFNNVLNIRIRMPIIREEHSKNFITKIFQYKKIHNMPNSMTYLPDFIPIIVDLSLNLQVGTFNCVNKGMISHKEIFDIYNELTNQNHDYELIEEKELNEILKSKRSNNILDTTKIEFYLEQSNTIDKKYKKLREIKDCIKEVFTRLVSTQEMDNKLMLDNLKLKTY